MKKTEIEMTRIIENRMILAKKEKERAYNDYISAAAKESAIESLYHDLGWAPDGWPVAESEIRGQNDVE